MSIHLATEARPLTYNKLVAYEQALLHEAYDWLDLIAKDIATHPRADAHAIDRNRSGRTLFIDGERGTGKTSFLLSLLAGLDSRVSHGDQDYRPRKKGNIRKPPCHRLLLPILDFDPLPHGMPLHGWLLEPWRKEAQYLEKKAPRACDNQGDLVEMCAEVFEQVVLGWAHVSASGQGVVERAIAYQHQAHSWIDTRRRWHDLVNAFLCRAAGCNKTDCTGHTDIYVVAIDDVDLQVERVPQLLHALRLLHHPNVAYVLTGNSKHLQFALEIDFVDRHTRRGHREPRAIGRSKELWGRIGDSSKVLADALLDKALPSHVRLELRHVTLEEAILITHNDNSTDGSGGEAVKSASEPRLGDLVQAAGKLHISTARSAQYASDRWRANKDKPNLKEDPNLLFLADLCKTTIKDGRLELRGQLTTKLGPVWGRWEGNSLTIKLTGTPPFVFFPDHDQDNPATGIAANQAAIVQLATEKTRAFAHGVAWRPDALILTTEARSGGREAILFWPILAQPKAADVLALQRDVDQFVKTGPKQSTTDYVTGRIHNTDGLFWRWINLNISWHLTQFHAANNHKKNHPETEPLPGDTTGSDAVEIETIDALKIQLETLSGEDHERNELGEIERWTRELIVLTAPYFGLSKELAHELRDELFEVQQKVQKRLATKYAKDPHAAFQPIAIREEQKKAVNNSLIYSSTAVANADGQRNSGFSDDARARDDDGASRRYDEATKEFLKDYRLMSKGDLWWTWLDKKEPLAQNEGNNDNPNKENE